MSQHHLSLNRRTFASTAGAGAIALGIAGPVAARQATPAPDGAAAWDALSQQVEAVAPLSAYLASEIVNGNLQPIAGVNADREQAVGSSFKLYILATIGLQVGAGTLAWGQPVAIEDRFKSVPGGDLRYVAAGTEFTLRYIAERMIQKSDNTATDTAMLTAGRENVEAMFETAGHANPGRNVPLLTTRELTMLKFLFPDVERYVAADIATRREILETEIDPLSYEDLLAVSEDQTAPVHIDTIEWFCSPTDLSNVMVYLKTQAESDFGLQPLFEIMALETQLTFDGETWPYVGFKGGSELGVLAGNWLMRRNDDRWFVLSMSFNDTEQGIDTEKAIAAMEGGVAALASVP